MMGADLAGLHPLPEADGACRLVYDSDYGLLHEVPLVLRDLAEDVLIGGLREGRLASPLCEWLETVRRNGLAGPVAMSGGTPPVTDVAFDLSGTCNLDCVYCFERDLGAPRGTMTEDVLLRGLDLLFEASAGAPLVTLHFSSGEPLLRFDLLARAVAEAKERATASGQRVEFHLTTNGTRVTAEIARFLAEENFLVRLSCDGPSDRHDSQRPFRGGVPSSHAVRRGLDLLLADPPRRFLVNVVLPTGARLMEYWRWARELEIPALHAIKAGVSRDDPLALQSAELDVYRSDLAAIAEELFDEAGAGSVTTRLQSLTSVLWWQLRGVQRRRACGVAGSLLSLASDGSLYPCYRFLGARDYSLGDLESGIHMEDRRAFLEEISPEVDARRKCRDCWARYLCGGGCYADSVFYGSDPRSPFTSHCAFWQAEIETALRLLHRFSEDPARLLSLYDEDLSALFERTVEGVSER